MFVTLARNDNVGCFKSLSTIFEFLGSPKFTDFNFKRLPIKDRDYQHTVLHEAVIHGNYKLVEYLTTMHDDEKLIMEKILF